MSFLLKYLNLLVNYQPSIPELLNLPSIFLTNKRLLCKNENVLLACLVLFVHLMKFGEYILSEVRLKFILLLHLLVSSSDLMQLVL